MLSILFKIANVIETTEDALNNEKRRSMKENAHRMVSALLISRLTDVQKKWDDENSVSSRFVQEKDNLWIYFQNVGNNLQSFALLSSILSTVFMSHFQEAFIHSLALYVYNTLRGKNWLTKMLIFYLIMLI